MRINALDLKVVDESGAPVTDDAARALMIAAAFAVPGGRVLLPDGSPLTAKSPIDWGPASALQIEPPWGRDLDGTWARASIFGRDIVYDPQFSNAEGGRMTNEEAE